VAQFQRNSGSLCVEYANNLLKNNDIRFFIGYSGWGNRQLEEELKEKSWIMSRPSCRMTFENNPAHLWKDALKNLGGEYSQMANYPIDPQLN